jgi:3-oxoadipate enol-lactonase
MPDVTSDGARIRFTAEGPPGAPALLLSHALGTSGELWRRQADALGRRFRLIRYDGRGHGRSTAPAGPYTLEQLGRDALAVLDAANAERAHVCGVSLGGQVALWLGAHAPDRVDRLVPANTGARIGTTALWNERIAAVRSAGLAPLVDGTVARWLTEPFRAREPDVVEALAADLLATSADGYTANCAAIRDADLEPVLGTIRAPTLVIAGRRDEATPIGLGRQLRDGIAGARMVTLDGAHLTNVECAAEFTAAVASFLGPGG